MPKVTLLSEGWKEHTLIYGKGKYTFRGNVAKTVPVPIALCCKKVKDSAGKALFKVEQMPAVLKSVKHAKVPAPNSEQNVEKVSRQLRLTDAVS